MIENKISIVTAIHNQLEYNKLFFESLVENTYYPFELIVINNNSVDGSGEFFKKHNAVVVDNKSNLPYSVSQNIGLNHAFCNYIAFLNNDIYLSKHWDKKLIDYLDTYSLDVISPCGIENMESESATRKFMRKWRYINLIQRIKSKLNLYCTKYDLKKFIYSMYGNWDKFISERAKKFNNYLYPGFAGNAIIARKSVFNIIGPWNEKVASADWDLNLRLVKNQIEQGIIKGPVIAGDVYVHHFIRASFRARKKESIPWNKLQKVEEFYSKNDLRYLKRPKASIIIAVYNHADFLEKIFLSLHNQSNTDFEIIASDDGSGPEIKKIIKRYTDTFLYPIQHVWHEDYGFRKTIIANKAVMLARSLYLIFIDGDCILHHKFVERHIKRGKQGTVFSGRRVKLDEELSNRITNEDIKLQKIEKKSNWYSHCEKSSRRFGVYNPLLFKFKNMFRGNYEIVGSNFSLYKGDYFRINGYDERIIGRGLEDNNLCNRFKNAKIKIKYISNEALQYHLFHTSNPIPHKECAIKNFGTPDYAWTQYGIIKTSKSPESE